MIGCVRVTSGVLLSHLPRSSFIPRVTIRPDLGGTVPLFQALSRCPAQIIVSPAFSFSQPEQLELGYANDSPDKLRIRTWGVISKKRKKVIACLTAPFVSFSA